MKIRVISDGKGHGTKILDENGYTLKALMNVTTGIRGAVTIMTLGDPSQFRPVTTRHIRLTKRTSPVTNATFNP